MSLLAFIYSEPYFWKPDVYESATSRRNKKKKAEREAKGIAEEKPFVPLDNPNFTLEENVKRGLDAVHSVITTHQDVMNVMYRKNIGWISFPWGNAGTPPPADPQALREWWDNLGSEENQRSAPFRGGGGLSHIIAKRDWEGKWIRSLLGQKGKDLAYSLVQAIAQGRKSTKGNKVILEYTPTNIRVILERKRANDMKTGVSADNWLVSSYEIVPSGKYEMIGKGADERKSC